MVQELASVSHGVTNDVMFTGKVKAVRKKTRLRR